MSEQDRQTQASAGTAPGGGTRPSTADIARGATSSDRDPGTPPGDGVERTQDGGAPLRQTDGAASSAPAAGATSSDGGRAPLFPADQAQELRSRWESIQVGFVDEPKAAVEQADSLVAEVMQSLASAFSSERSSLEGQWSKGEDVSTEDLRQTLRRYRSFFDRLLSL